MSKFELTVDDPICEDLALRWQSATISALNQILKAHKVEESGTREKILEEFFFELAVQFDGSSRGIEFENREFRPRLVFQSPDNPAKIMISDKYDLHDNTHWDIAAVIEEGSDSQ